MLEPVFGPLLVAGRWGFLGGWAGGSPCPGARGQGRGCCLLIMCSWAIAAFVHHMMAWLPVSSPGRAIQPAFITALRAESRKREEDK